jgi:hypothetical protein
MTIEYCPNCSTPRVGSFRYCRSCQFDFDSLAASPTTTTAAVPRPVASAGQVPMDRRAIAGSYRSAVYWSCLLRVMVGIGLVAGFVVGAYLGSGLGPSNILLQLALGFIIGPLVGAVIAWRLWTSLWASGGPK